MVRPDLEPIKPKALAVRIVSDAAPALAEALGLQTGARTLAIVTATSDDALFAALDQGTKAAPVDVVYARSFYAGSGYPSGPLSGECLGIYAGATPAEVEAGVEACLRYLDDEAWFYAADDAGKLAFFPHVLAATGRYLAPQAGILPGEPMAYLIAPPAESVIAVDQALKAARVRMTKWFGPPTETNFGGAYLTGDLPACEAAARAFAAAVVDVARRPRPGVSDARGSGDDTATSVLASAIASATARAPTTAGASAPGDATTAARAGASRAADPGRRFRVLATGERLDHKPDHLTHLVDDQSLVPKTHPRIVLRGKLDLVQSAILDAQVAADGEGAAALVGELGELLELARALVGAEVTGRPVPDFHLGALGADAIRDATHHTHELYGVPFMYPDVRHGAVVSRLNLARGFAREAELAALIAFAAEGSHRASAPPTRPDLCRAINRLSSALYLLTARYVGGQYPGARAVRGPVRGWKPPAAG